MASLMPQNLACFNVADDHELTKSSEALEAINGALLFSLMEETSQGEDQNDIERLNSVMQSLEAEINSSISGNLGSMIDHKSSNDDEVSQSSEVEYTDGRDLSASLDHEFGWFDVEMVPSSPSDDINSYMDPCEDEMDSIIEFEGVREYYSQIYYGVPLEEHRYSSLWHEIDDTEMY